MSAIVVLASQQPRYMPPSQLIKLVGEKRRTEEGGGEAKRDREEARPRPRVCCVLFWDEEGEELHREFLKEQHLSRVINE